VAAGAERALAEAQAAEAVGKAKASAAGKARGGAPGAKTAAPAENPFAWAYEGADEVLVLRAASADEARAQVGLLVQALEDRGTLPALDIGRALAGPSAESDAPADARKDLARRDARPRGGGGAPDADAEAPAAEVALLTFRLDLAPEAWARLTAALAVRPGETHGADDKVPPSAAAAAPVPAEVPSAKPAAPPRTPAPASGAGDAAPPTLRRVRIVVLPR
jgi:hypothetical protein